jgi:hypothetical protein
MLATVRLSEAARRRDAAGGSAGGRALCGHSGTVLYVAWLTKPSVPSLPMSKRLMISTGSDSGKSTSALSE